MREDHQLNNMTNLVISSWWQITYQGIQNNTPTQKLYQLCGMSGYCILFMHVQLSRTLLTQHHAMPNSGFSAAHFFC